MSNQFLDIFVKKVLESRTTYSENDLVPRFKLAVKSLPTSNLKSELEANLDNYSEELCKRVLKIKSTSPAELIKIILENVETLKQKYDDSFSSIISILSKMNMCFSTLLNTWYEKPMKDTSSLIPLTQGLHFIINYYTYIAIFQNIPESTKTTLTNEFNTFFNSIMSFIIIYQKEESVKNLYSSFYLVISKEQVLLYQLLSSIPNLPIFNNQHKSTYFSTKLIKNLYDNAIFYVYPIPNNDALLKEQYKQCVEIYYELAKLYFPDRVGNVKAIQIKINYTES